MQERGVLLSAASATGEIARYHYIPLHDNHYTRGLVLTRMIAKKGRATVKIYFFASSRAILSDVFIFLIFKIINVLSAFVLLAFYPDALAP